MTFRHVIDDLVRLMPKAVPLTELRFAQRVAGVDPALGVRRAIDEAALPVAKKQKKT